jgi:hypothetical protein
LSVFAVFSLFLTQERVNKSKLAPNYFSCFVCQSACNNQPREEQMTPHSFFSETLKNILKLQNNFLPLVLSLLYRNEILFSKEVPYNTIFKEWLC